MVNEVVVKVCVETNEFYVVDKPPGIGFHDEDGKEGYFSHCKRELCIGDREELYPVHRLDKDTSGLLILARSSEAARVFSDLFEKREIQKLYIALSNKKSKKKQGTVRGDMERSRRKSWKLCKSMTNPAITQFFSFGLGEGLRLFIIRILTGKTHQIRVALKSQGSAIWGDSIYSGAEGGRLYLHAWSLTFRYKDHDFRVVSYPEHGKMWIDNREKIESFLSKSDNFTWPRIKQQKK